MADTTIRLNVGTNDALLADYRNAFYPVQKNVFIFARRYVVADGDYTATDALIIQFDGGQEILYQDAKEVLAASTAPISSTEADISGTGRQGKQITTAASNASSLAVELFAIVRV